MELKERYTTMIIEQRRRKFEKEWERKHIGKNYHHNTRHAANSNHGTNGRNRSNSIGSGGSMGGGGSGGSGGSDGKNRSNSTSSSGSCGGGRSNSSGSFKMEMSSEEKEELDKLLALPVILPEGMLETRPYDYRKKDEKISKKKQQQQHDKNHHANDNMTEEEELFRMHGGRNPLFMAMKGGTSTCLVEG